MTAKKRDFDRTRAAILKVAFVEVYTRGFQGVSVDDIVKKNKSHQGCLLSSLSD